MACRFHLLPLLALLAGLATPARAADPAATLNTLIEASRLPRFTQPAWRRADRAAERVTVEALTTAIPAPLRPPVRPLLAAALHDRVHLAPRFTSVEVGGARLPVLADLDRLRQGTFFQWHRIAGPLRLPFPDLPLVDIDIPLVDKVGHIGPIPLVAPEILVR
ncbi:MAG: hypothetical protein D6739_11755 [Nitrospirae bacterium]|nr:MAG: hypothetical protein D6739_11755 [Nitrospirota bacterium]